MSEQTYFNLLRCRLCGRLVAKQEYESNNPPPLSAFAEHKCPGAPLFNPDGDFTPYFDYIGFSNYTPSDKAEAIYIIDDKDTLLLVDKDGNEIKEF